MTNKLYLGIMIGFFACIVFVFIGNYVASQTVSFRHIDQFTYTRAVCVDLVCADIQDVLITCRDKAVISVIVLGEPIPNPKRHTNADIELKDYCARD